MEFRALFQYCRRVVKSRLSLFALLWTCGLLIGICSANAYAFSYEIAGKSMISKQPLLISVLFVTVIPIVLTFVSLRYVRWGCMCVVITVDAMSRGYCGTLVFHAFGSAAWLIRHLYLFSSICTSVLMWWLIVRHNRVDLNRFKRDGLICVLSAAVVAVADIYFVAPFLMDLSKYI